MFDRSSFVWTTATTFCYFESCIIWITVTVFKPTLKRNAFKQAKLNRSDLTLPSYCFIELNLRNSESSAFRGIAPDYEIELNL